MSKKIVYMGTPEFAVPPLQRLLELDEYKITGVICQPDRPSGRHLQLAVPPVKQLALEHGLTVLQPEKVRTAEFLAELAQLEPDVIVTAAYGRILPRTVLDLPPFGCLNVHASLLPAYRGAAPIQWSIVRGEQETGITFMLMDEGMDTGPILAQESLVITDDMNAGQLSEQLAQLGARLLPQVLADWLAGRIQPQAQDETKAFAIPLLKRRDGELDWSKSAQAVYNQIRGFYPWPGSYTWCGKKRMKIHRAQINHDPELNEAARSLPEGTICQCSGDRISVACGQGVLDLLEIQTGSGKRMSCRDCAHNYRLGQLMGGEN